MDGAELSVSQWGQFLVEWDQESQFFLTTSQKNFNSDTTSKLSVILEKEDMLNKTLENILRFGLLVNPVLDAQNENNQDIETVLKWSHKKSKTTVPSKLNNYVCNLIPLTLEDVAYINRTDDIRDFKTIYGLSFRNIIVYGLVTLFKQNKDFSLYHVDDGTGSIIVKYSKHHNLELDLQKNINQLEENIMIAKKHGIPYLEKNYSSESEQCRQHLENIKSFLDVIKSRHNSYNKIIEILHKNGEKMAIMGSPYEFNGNMCVYAFCMQVDDKPNRNIEINFKRNLVQWHKTKYKGFFRNGTIKY